MPPKTRGAVRKPRRKDKKNIALGQAHIKAPLTTPSFPSRIRTVLSSHGLLPVKLASRARVSQLRTLHRWLLKQLPSAHRSMAFARLTFS